MAHLGLWRGLLGGAVLAGCIALLAGQGRAATGDSSSLPLLALGATAALPAPLLEENSPPIGSRLLDVFSESTAVTRAPR